MPHVERGPGEGITGATVHVAAGSYAEESVVAVDATILGAGADETELGPLSIWDRDATVTIADVAIAGGYRTGGGGVSNSGTLTLRNVVVRDNTAWAGEGFQAFGAGVFNTGTLTLEDSTVRDNTAIGIGDDERSGWGGGIHNRGSLTVTGGTISGKRGSRRRRAVQRRRSDNDDEHSEQQLSEGQRGRDRNHVTRNYIAGVRHDHGKLQRQRRQRLRRRRWRGI